MTKLLETALEAVQKLSPEAQDYIARTILEIVEAGATEDIYVLSPEEEAAIDEGLAAADRGEFATEEELAAILAKYRA